MTALALAPETAALLDMDARFLAEQRAHQSEYSRALDLAEFHLIGNIKGILLARLGAPEERLARIEERLALYDQAKMEREA